MGITTVGSVELLQRAPHSSSPSLALPPHSLSSSHTLPTSLPLARPCTPSPSPSHALTCRPRDDGDPRHSPSPPRKPLALALVLERRRRHLRLADDGEPLALPNSPSPSLSHALSPSHSPSPSHTITFALRTMARACDDGEPRRSPSSLPLYALTTLPSPSYAVARPPHLARPRRTPTPSHAHVARTSPPWLLQARRCPSSQPHPSIWTTTSLPSPFTLARCRSPRLPHLAFPSCVPALSLAVACPPNHTPFPPCLPSSPYAITVVVARPAHMDTPSLPNHRLKWIG
ncbi:hypothetical protein EV363DRAFT_1567101 [Boletus edulis]|nr:hypothetical protein EV363DRAFT_1567101 [Boletus edulis]